MGERVEGRVLPLLFICPVSVLLSFLTLVPRYISLFPSLLVFCLPVCMRVDNNDCVFHAGRLLAEVGREKWMKS